LIQAALALICASCGQSCVDCPPTPKYQACTAAPGNAVRLELGDDYGNGFEPWVDDDRRAYACPPPDRLGVCINYMKLRLRTDSAAPACLNYQLLVSDTQGKQLADLSGSAPMIVDGITRVSQPISIPVDTFPSRILITATAGGQTANARLNGCAPLLDASATDR
jgi:hypothetical protein